MWIIKSLRLSLSVDILSSAGTLILTFNFELIYYEVWLIEDFLFETIFRAVSSESI